MNSRLISAERTGDAHPGVYRCRDCMEVYPIGGDVPIKHYTGPEI